MLDSARRLYSDISIVGRYLCEELRADPRFKVVVLSRKLGVSRPCFAILAFGRAVLKREQQSGWISSNRYHVFETDYSESSVGDILSQTRPSALISFIQPPDELYVPIHTALLNACSKSATCKRFIPSEWVGNIDDFPMLPAFYGASREPFRQILRQTEWVESTLFCGGWLADYFLPKDRTHMPAIPDEFPVDPNNFRALIRGTGDEPQSWTSAREVAKAVVKLLDAPKWVRSFLFLST